MLPEEESNGLEVYNRILCDTYTYMYIRSSNDVGVWNPAESISKNGQQAPPFFVVARFQGYTRHRLSVGTTKQIGIYEVEFSMMYGFKQPVIV